MTTTEQQAVPVAQECSYKAHFELMQDMMRRYIEPITYVASFPADSTKRASEFEEPGPHDSSTNSEGKRRRMDRAFISDMIHMMDGPEQRALPHPRKSGEGAGEGERQEAMRMAANALAPFSADAPATPTRLALVILNAAINHQSPQCQRVLTKLPDLALSLATLTPDATQTREAELVAALKPFARLAQYMGSKEALVIGWNHDNVSYSDFRRARAALNARGGA